MVRLMLSHPVLLAAFRPFFLLAFLLGTVLPVAWAMLYTGAIAMPPGGLVPMHWHAHEMLFGFGGAVLFGFLLTASKNWVQVRGIHGGALALAVVLFLVERAAVFFFGATPREPLAFVLLNAFGLYVVAYIVWTLVSNRARDTYADNWLFVVVLPCFVVAKNLMLDPAFRVIGTATVLGLFRVAFTIMFERTITQFMRNAMKVELKTRPALDRAIKGLVLLAAFEAFIPPKFAALVLALAALFSLVRLLTWKPLVAFRNFGIGVMYVGYAGLIVHLMLVATARAGVNLGTGTLSTHVFTFGCMGLVIPSMLIRIAQGHTGRPPLFATTDRVALVLMGVGGLLRVVATQLWPAGYTVFVVLSAIAWSICFAMVGARVGPFLLLPRVDGKEH